MNPRGTVPLFIDGTARMTESAAICEYLAQQVRADDSASAWRGRLRGLSQLPARPGDTTLTFPQTLVLRYSQFEPPGACNHWSRRTMARWFHARLRTLEAHVAKHTVPLRRVFTATDVAVGYALMLAELLGLDDRFPRPSPSAGSAWVAGQRIGARWQRRIARRVTGCSPLPATA